MTLDECYAACRTGTPWSGCVAFYSEATQAQSSDDTVRATCHWTDDAAGIDPDDPDRGQTVLVLTIDPVVPSVYNEAVVVEGVAGQFPSPPPPPPPPMPPQELDSCTNGTWCGCGLGLGFGLGPGWGLGLALG